MKLNWWVVVLTLTILFLCGLILNKLFRAQDELKPPIRKSNITVPVKEYKPPPKKPFYNSIKPIKFLLL
jgi:hypothetical protein